MAVATDGALERFGIGAGLREARIRRGLELADVERETCIRAANLAAIEDERFEALPGAVYAAGFVRAYADFLGLDAERYVAAFHRLHPAPAPLLRAAPMPAAAPGLRLRRLALPVAAVLAAAAVAAVLLLPRSHPRTPAPTVPAPRAKHTARPPAPAYPGPLTIRAATGASWVSVRFGGPHGRTVWQGTLAQGGRLRFGLARPLWVGLGAPENVTARIGSKPLALVPGRSQFVFSPAGVRRG